jgi:DNA-binding MarR family transcriptional regulator
VIELLFSYVDRLRTHLEIVAQTHGLTPVQAKVLMFLDESEPMHCIAANLSCDPSNVTGVVDRLQERGLLMREEARTDRRVKILQVTPAGKKLRDAFMNDLFRDVPGMNGLSRSQIKGLRDALAMLCGEEASKASTAADVR